jgi:hypothetical protein
MPPNNRGGRPRSITGPMRDAIRQYLEDLVGSLFAEYEFPVTSSTVSRALKSMGLSKKVARRHLFIFHSAILCPLWHIGARNTILPVQAFASVDHLVVSWSFCLVDYVQVLLQRTKTFAIRIDAQSWRGGYTS